MSSAQMKEEVLRAQEIQKKRYETERISYNSELTPALIEVYCPLGQREQALLKTAFGRLQLSARGYHKILKVARPVADLDGSEEILVSHLAEVIQYRNLDRKYRF